MFRFGSSGRDFEAFAARCRRLHSLWLSRAVRHGGGKGLPRIPVRRVSDGGFDTVMSTEEGRQWAQTWWSEALTFERQN